MTRVALVAAAAAALLLGAVSGARITGRNPYWLGTAGGVILYINGEDFSEDQFSQFDPSLGNRVFLVNEEDEIECAVIEYLTNVNRIACSTGPRTKPSAPTVYEVIVYSDGVRAEGSTTVQYGWWLTPKIEAVTPHWSLPGNEVTFSGWLQTDRYYQIDLEDSLENNPDKGNILTKVFLGGVECDMFDENEELRGTFNSGQLTCLPRAKLIGAMNTSLYVNERGASLQNRHKMYVDSQDKLFQYHSYPAINSVSPSSGSQFGGTLITVDGIGFDPYKEQTKVEVGGVECSIQEITDDQIKCLTPYKGLIESPGAGERGILVELYKGETLTNSEFWQEEKWAALDSSHAGYESFTSNVPELSFPLTISENTVGRVRALFHPPHDGQYTILGNAGNATSVRIASDGNPENAVTQQPIELKKGTPAYVEVRFRADGDTEVLMRMKDYNSRYVNSQTFRGSNEKQQVKLDISQVWEKQMVEITGVTTPVTLFMNGISSAPVDISDSALVREQLMDMTEQKCENDFSGLNVRHYTNFEDGSRPPGALGSIVDDLPPYCGRKMFKLKRSDPRVYRETDDAEMVNANTHRYLCLAVSGKLQTSMAINFVWKDNNGKRRDNTFWFEREFSPSGWMYHCEDLQGVMADSWAASQYTNGAKLLVKNIVLPKPLGPTDDVYIDEVVFLSDAFTVSQSRPSALKQGGILVEDVQVQDETEEGYALRFITSNCKAGMPLLGVFDGEADNSLIEVLSTSQSYNFPIGDGSVAVSRVDTATNPLGGTWDISILGREVKDIPADVHETVLQSYLEAALGTDLKVTYGGNCKNYQYYIEWLVDPGLKELVVVDDSNLVFDGDFTASVKRDREGMIWHDPLPADFMTAYRDTPHVTVRVNGYSAACLGDCAFTYESAGTPSHSSSSISVPTYTDPVTIQVFGEGFTSNDLSDYSASLGDVQCSAVSVDNTQEENTLTVSCDVSVAGTYPFRVLMQPYGVFSFLGTVTLHPTVTSLSITEGPMTGYYPITVYGAGFPSDAPGWETEDSYIKIGEDNCEVISSEPTEVTCMVPPHETASSALSVTVFVEGASTSYGGFTYTAVSEVPTITSLSSTSLSVYGQEELIITGSVFGSDAGTVKIGSEPCVVSSWSAGSVTCTTPSLAPGSYSISLLTNGLGMAETNVNYVFLVTSASKLKGSVKGGTMVTLKGQGFGLDCSLLKVQLGEKDECEVIECTPTSLTCVTKLVPTRHEITNSGKSSEESVLWSPRVLDVREGDTVTWKWNKVSENTQLKYSVCQVPHPLANCEDDDGTGFNSGSPTESGQFTVTFNHHGIYYFAGQPASTAGLIMRGQINVIRPPTEARKMTVMLGSQEATINLSGAEEPIARDGCSANQAPLADCTVPDLAIPDDGNLYFLAHTCHTPVVSRMYTDSFTGIPGLSGIQVIEGVAFNIEGSGFNDESNEECKTVVRIGAASCAVSQSAGTQVTCDPSLEDLGVSFYPVMVQVFGNGLAAMQLSDYDSEGRVVVVPSVASFSPVEGSLAGGTLITITGSGLQGVSTQPVVLLGGKACTLQEVSPTSVTCLTPASATATTATLTVTVMGLEAILSESLPSYTYSEALTPMLTGVAVTGETVTLSGQNFGSDSSKLTVTLRRDTSPHQRDEVEDKEEELMVEIDEDYIEDFKDDEEMERMVSGYMDEREVSTADTVRKEKGQRHLRRRLKLALADIVEAPEGFWGTFTGTEAKTFKETVMMGAWQMGGTSVNTRTDGDGDDSHVVPKLKKRSADDLPSEYSCVVTSASDTEASCTASGLPAGTYTAEVVLDGAGYALQDGLTASAEPVISSISPTSGSVHGGALLTILGSGFIDGDTSVLVGASPCPVEDVSSRTITCRVAQGTDGSGEPVVVTVTGSSDVTAASTFTYDSAVTPALDSLTPSSVTGGGTTLTLTGSSFMQGDSEPEVTVGGATCVVTSAINTKIECTAPALPGGSYDVVVREATYGDSNIMNLIYESGVDSATLEGSFGGSLITISGYGFDPAGGTTITVCDDKPCEIVGSPSATEISCIVPAEPYTGEDKSCDLKVIQPDGSTTTTLTYQYLASKTSFITSIGPKRGGTAGGTTLTITGTGFESSGNVVTIGGSSCEVTSESSTSITCRTSSHQGPGEFAVRVDVPNKGFAVTDENGVFFYIDRWSSVFTWGNNPVPSEGQLAVIDEGQTVLIDQSTPVLKMLLVQGGHVIFDVEATEELVLRAEYILVVGGGSLSIGSEEEAFPGKAVIELHGNTQSTELPIYGAKVLAVRDGTLDLHGAHVPITWTYLQDTASTGASSITLADGVTWKAGDQIVIASTGLRFPRNENEVRTIQSVSDDGRTIAFSEPLEYEHVAVTQTLAGREVTTRAEVGLLTRNVKIRGAINEDFTELIEGCETQFNPNQFATQTCFNGRYGDEVASDQFGATVMLFGKYPDQELVTGRIEYIEVTEAGQAFQLGRYPLHFHMVGNVASSYIRGCAVHRTYNRAITIHAANYLTVERNVAYDNMGHAIFTEDGVEQNNVIQYNLAIYTRTSSSLLNVDVTPSSFWVVNPNNIVRHNAAAGGTHFGYWYRIERHPSGPSATNSYCPNNEVMGQFFNNTAHSMGRYGLWVFSMDGYHPRAGTCKGTDLVARWEDFTVWHCERGAEVVFGSNLQFHNFVALNNKLSGLEMVKMKGGNRLGDSPGIFNSLVACHSALGNEFCTDKTSGIVAPKQYIFSISGVTFVNYDVTGSSALSGCSQCKERQGGFRAQVEDLNFVSSPNRLKFLWEHETIWIDEDGSLSGTAGASVVPWMDILPSDACSTATELSVNSEVPGAVCSSDMEFLRYNIKGPNIEPPSLQGRDLIVTNEHGSVSVPYRVKRLTTEGWMGILFTGDTYEWYFDDSSQITNITYSAETRLVSPGDHYYVKHKLMQEPDYFGTTGEAQESKPALPNPSTDFHGDYFWDSGNKEITYMVSYNLETKKNLREFTKDAGTQRDIKFRVYRNAPTPPPVPTGRPDTVLYWSDVETWKEVPVGSGGHPTETEYNLPVEGDEIIIPQGMWLIVDTATPKLGRVYVYGTLEFDDTMDHYFEATIIYIQGGMVAAGLSKSEPFTHQLEIQLRGSIDPNDPDNEEFPMPEGVPTVGWKAIGVFGALKLHGTVSGQSWHKLGATAEAGSTTVTLAEAPDASWLNKMVVVSTTSKEAMESEVRTVVAIDSTTLTLDTSLEFQHLGVTHTLSDGTSITLAGEVGLLSRNIVVRGSPTEDSFGGRIVVSRINQDGVDYVGSIQLDGVLLDNMGQESFTDLDDPRYSLAVVGLGTIDDGSSYVSRSSFSINYNVALGLFSTSNMEVEDNVIYYALDSGVRDESGLNTYKKNLITTVLFLGTYGDRFDTQNLNWYGAFHLDNAPNTALEGNVVAGAEQAGFKTYGEICEDEALWQDNEVHSTIFGVMSWRKSGMGEECRKIHDFFAWRITDTAFYVHHYASSLIENVISVDNPLGINQLIMGPRALTHKFAEKYAITKASLFVGASPSHTCTFQKSTTEIMTFYGSKIWNGGVDGGNTAILFGTFMSAANLAPKFSFSPSDTYPALHGHTEIKDNKFINFNTRSCGRNVALMANPGSDDAIHPIFVSGLAFVDTPTDNYVFIPRANVERVNPSDCVDMDCDGHKKVVLKDTDGSLLNTADSTLISEAEYEWDGDPRRGVGDYRIPVSLRQNDNGSQIPAADKFPNKGIVRDSTCTLVAPWQAWMCESLQHFMMIIESMDTDTEVRRLSPIALIANPGTRGFVDLLNGPMDVGWCFGYTCQERISTFYAVLASEQVYEMAMTSTPPQVLRLHPLTHSEEVVVLRIFFPKLQRYDIYVDDAYVPPTNIDTTASKYQLIPENPDDPEAFFPTLSDPVGSNYLQRSAKLLHVVVGKSQIVTIKTTPMITLQSGLVVTNDEFYEENLLQNLVDLFGLSAENIRITNIVPEDSRRRWTRAETVTMDVSAEIGSAPTDSLDGSESAIDAPVIPYDTLVSALQVAVNKYQEGSCETCASLKVISPANPPPAEAPPKATEEEGSVIIEGGELFSEKQQKEEEAALNKSIEAVDFSKPTTSEILTGVPTFVVVDTKFAQQPSIIVRDDQGEIVKDLGFETDPWRITATLTGGPTGAVLEGSITVPYVEGSASFTDLAVSEPGEGYSLSFTITHPSDAPALTTALDQTFSARTEIPMAVVISLPEGILRAGQPISLSVQLVDEDSGALLDGAMFQDQVIVGELLEKRGPKGKPTVIKRFHEMFTSKSEIPLEITVDEAAVRYQLFARVSIVPGEWYLEGKTPRLVVYPSDVSMPENPVTNAVQIELHRPKLLPDVEMDLEDAVLEWLMKNFNMAERNIVWGPVTIPTNVRKMVKAEFQISGPSDQVAATLDDLCKKLLSRTRVKVDYNGRPTAYTLRKVYVDGKHHRCKRMLPVAEATVRNKSEVLNSTQTLTVIGRHKFNRG